MQGLGVQWFNISLDDIKHGIDASGQAHVVNEILHRLRAKDPNAQMIFCPTFYWGDGTGNKAQPYLETLAREIDPDVFFFWTGGEVVGPVHRKDAESFKRITKHRLFLWDNYPVNDSKRTMHLGPVTGREADLCDVIDGYMCNPHHTQNEINRIPMFTCADYAYNPRAYDPARSISQAIVHVEPDHEGQTILAELVNAYPGMLIWGSGDTGCNPVRERMKKYMALPDVGVTAKAYAQTVHSLVYRFEAFYPNRYSAEKKTLRDDLIWLDAH
jgi:hypothetical protein